MAHDIINKKMSVADTQNMVKKTNRSKTSRAFTNNTLSAEYVAKTESKISKCLKTPVKLHERRGGAGEIVIKFANRIQMEELIEKLTK